MPIPAAYIVDRCRQVKILVVGRLHTPNQGAEIRQVLQVQEEVIFHHQECHCEKRSDDTCTALHLVQCR